MKKEGFIYIWFDRKRKMFYIGCHWGTVDDGYICSSNRMRDAYRRRPQDFRRRIIQSNISQETLLAEEHKWLMLIPDDQLGIKYYNLRKHKWVHWYTDQNKKASIGEKISLANKGRKHPNRKSPSPFTKEHLAKMSARMKGNTITLGFKHSDETKQMMSEKRKGRLMSEEARRRISQTLMGHTHSDETKQKISETQKGKKLSAETRLKMSQARKGKPKVTGSGRRSRVQAI